MNEEFDKKYQGMNDSERLKSLRGLVLGVEKPLNKIDLADELNYIFLSLDKNKKLQSEAYFYMRYSGVYSRC